jgi:lysophospholipid acyltransferase
MFGATFVVILCLILKEIKDPTMRRAFSLFFGLSINFFVFGSCAFCMLSVNLFVYLMMICCPSKYQHIGVFLIAGLGLAGAQWHKMIYDYGMNGLNLPITMMFNYCRISSLACCIKDGTVISAARKAKGDDVTRKIPHSELGVDLKRRELKYAQEDVPTLFEFLSYLYFVGSCISGPWFEFGDFNDLIKRQGEFKDVPSTWKKSLMIYLEAWLCVFIGIVLGKVLNKDYYVSEEFAAKPLYWKIYLIYFFGRVVMYKTYLVGWCLMDLGPIASGLSFNGYDEEGNAKFDRVRSMNHWKLITATNVKTIIETWNISAHAWLKHYVFLRQLENGKRGQSNIMATWITFMVSAIWHGFYPGYYYFFFWVALFDYHCKLVIQVFGKVPIPQIISAPLACIWCFYGISYFGMSFVFLGISKYQQAFAEVYYWLQIVIAVTLPILILI